MGIGRRVFCVCMVAVSAAQAAEPSRDDVLQAQEQQRQQALREQAAARTPTLRAAKGLPRQPVVAGEAPCFSVDTLSVAGPEGTTFWHLHGALQDEFAAVRGLCLGANALAALHFNLTARLQQEGWVTSRLSMPAQNLASGELRVQWVPGVIESVRGEPAGVGVGLASLPLAPGQPLTVAALDQAADLYNRLPSLSARLLVLPGSHEQSNAVVAEVQAGRTWRSTLLLDNTGAREYGRTQAAWQVAVDRPSQWLGVNALLDQVQADIGINAERRAHDHTNLSAAMQYWLPLGNHLFDLHAQRGQFGRRVQGTTVNFVNRGVDRSAGLRWTWAAHRTERSKWALWAGLDKRSARRDIDDVELVLQRRRTLGVEAGLSLWHRAPAGDHAIDWAADASHTRTRRSGTPAAFEPAPGPAMQEQRVSVGFNAPLAAFMPQAPDEGSRLTPTVSVRLHAQSVQHPLTDADLPLIGTRYAVRGFDGNAPLQGRHAAVLRTDLRLPPLTWWGGQAQVAPYVGLDVGTVRGLAARPGSARTLSGVVAGLQARADRLAAELALAAPLRKAPGSSPARWVPTLRLSLDL